MQGSCLCGTYCSEPLPSTSWTKELDCGEFLESSSLTLRNQLYGLGHVHVLSVARTGSAFCNMLLSEWAAVYSNIPKKGPIYSPQGKECQPCLFITQRELCTSSICWAEGSLNLLKFILDLTVDLEKWALICPELKNHAGCIDKTLSQST